MKRHPALRPLSDDHHRALVLARRLRRDAIPGDAIAALGREVRRTFEDELEPHFRTEEHRLLPALAALGCTPLVERTAHDHARLRALVRGPFSEETARALGTLLEAHVRFEERVLFPEAERRMSEGELDAVRDAWLRETESAAPPPREEGARARLGVRRARRTRRCACRRGGRRLP